MSFRRLLLIACAAFVAAPFEAAASSGTLLAAVPQPHGNDWAIVDLPSGTEHPLPRSPSAQTAGSADIWSASRRPGTHTPRFVGDVHLSPDGLHVVGYWRSDGRTAFMVPGGPSAYEAANFQNACPHVIALPADSAPRPVDGLQDPPDMTLRTSAGEVRARGHAQWIALKRTQTRLPSCPGRFS